MARESSRAWLSSRSDAQLAALIGAALFALAAWPLLLVQQLPYQELPKHLAIAEVVLHLDRHPAFAFTGFLDTNVALDAWLRGVGRVVGPPLAAKLFVAITMAATALVLPRFVLAFADAGARGRMVAASFCAWPLVHSWFVAAGMLDFALAIPLAMALAMALRAQAIAASWSRGAVALGAAIALGCAHATMLAIVAMLAVVHVATRPRGGDRVALASALLLPLAPATLVALSSLGDRLAAAGGVAAAGAVAWRGPIDLAVALWSECAGGFTTLSIASAAAVLVAAAWAVRRWREAPILFGPAALGVLAAAYALTPASAHLGSRLLPMLYLAALVRAPESPSPRTLAVLGACAVAWSASLGVDYVRLDRDRARFTAGIDAVPDGARLLPLVFAGRITSETTQSLANAWGYYVIAKHTSAPLLAADERGHPLTWRGSRHAVVAHALDAPARATPESFCARLRADGVEVDDCPALWRSEWDTFWIDAARSFDHVLVWMAPPAVLATVPPSLFRRAFDRDGLVILERAR